jgi:DNA-binding NarL/FixJ family response regulator
MPSTPFDAIVISQRGLIRELLADLLRDRGGSRRIAACASLAEGLAQARTARLLVCDVSGFPDDSLSGFVDQLRDRYPDLRVVMLDDSVGECRAADVVKAIHAEQPLPQPHDLLTPLESRVILAVASGQRNSSIARRMRRSSKTVEKHRANAMRKLGLKTVAQLTAYTIRHGLLDAREILESDDRPGSDPGRRVRASS